MTRARAIVLATLLSMLATGSVAAVVDGASSGTIDGRVLMSPLSIALVVSPSTVAVGDSLSAQATLSNLSRAPVTQISVRLRVATGLIVRTRPTRSVRVLPAGATTTIGWSVCGNVAGSYLVFAEATFGSIVIDSPARLVIVRPGPGRCTGGNSKHG